MKTEKGEKTSYTGITKEKILDSQRKTTNHSQSKIIVSNEITDSHWHAEPTCTEITSTMRHASCMFEP
jgi:hypothetical protein